MKHTATAVVVLVGFCLWVAIRGALNLLAVLATGNEDRLTAQRGVARCDAVAAVPAVWVGGYALGQSTTLWYPNTLALLLLVAAFYVAVKFGPLRNLARRISWGGSGKPTE